MQRSLRCPYVYAGAAAFAAAVACIPPAAAFDAAAGVWRGTFPIAGPHLLRLLVMVVVVVVMVVVMVVFYRSSSDRRDRGPSAVDLPG